MKKIYIITMALLLCSCSISKKAATKVNAGIVVTEQKESVSKMETIASLDTTKTIVTELTVEETPTEVINYSGLGIIQLKRLDKNILRTIHYKKTESNNGITSIEKRDTQLSNKEVKAEAKAIVVKKKSVYADLMEHSNLLFVIILFSIVFAVIFFMRRR